MCVDGRSSKFNQRWSSFYHPNCTLLHSLYLNQNKELTRAKKGLIVWKILTERQGGTASWLFAHRRAKLGIGTKSATRYHFSYCLYSVSRQCYCFGKWWLVSGFGWKCHKKWQLALSELFTYGINHVGRRKPPEWLSAGDFQSFMIAFVKGKKQSDSDSFESSLGFEIGHHSFKPHDYLTIRLIKLVSY